MGSVGKNIPRYDPDIGVPSRLVSPVIYITKDVSGGR